MNCPAIFRSLWPASLGAWLAVALLLGGCSKAPPPAADLLATVGGVELRLEDLERELARQSRGGGPPPARAAVLEELINRQALVGQARARGLHEDPELRRAWENLLITALKERELEPKLEQIEVEAEEVETLAAQARAQAAANPVTQSRMAVLFLPATRFLSDARQAELKNNLLEAARKVRELPPGDFSFGPLAIDYSEDQATRFKGGDMGWFDHNPDRYAYDSNVLGAAFNLAEQGDISEPIQTPDGYYLVRLMDRRSASPADSQTDPAALFRTLQVQKRQAVEREFIEAVRQDQKVTLGEAGMALRTAPVPAPTGNKAAPSEDLSGRPNGAFLETD